MSLESPSRINSQLLPLPGEGNSEYRQRIARQQEERRAHRQQELDEQTSLFNAPHQRIGWWERLHFMRLPVDPEHPLLSVVAKQTALSLEQVRLEQQRRRAAKSAVATES